MSEDITRIFDEYTEQLLFCKYFVANKLKHNAEMGRCGENILKKELQQRFQTLIFVTGFIVVDGKQSTQCDILVCKQSMHKREMEGGIFLVNPKDCLMVIEVKGNMTIADFEETMNKNQFFSKYEQTQHIKLALFAYCTRVGKRSLYQKFGYKYKRATKSYESSKLQESLFLDYFICLHRDSPASEEKAKQVFFIKDGQEPLNYILLNEFPITRNFFNLIDSMQQYFA